jgi:thiamine biosynthesis lipoprotein
MRYGEFHAMGTTVRAWTETESDFRATVSWFERVEAICSRFRDDSELTRVNRDASETVALSPVLASVVSHAAEMRQLTGGLVDAGTGAALMAWGYDRTFEEVTDSDRPPVSTPESEWSVDAGVLTRKPGTIIDLGGVGKGWTCDVAVETGLASVVSAGGDLRSAHPNTRVPIEDPWGDTIATIPLGLGALATSSTTRRRWRVGDRMAHHLIDPRTGRPADTPILSATVVAGTATEAEAGAKAVLLLGEDGLSWAADQAWIEAALAVWHDGSVFGTKGLKLAA